MKGKAATQTIAFFLAALLLISALVLNTQTAYAAENYNANILLNGSFADEFNNWVLDGDTTNLTCENEYVNSPDLTEAEGYVCIYYPMEVGSASLSQVVDLTDYTANIAQGFVGLELSGYAGKATSVSTNKIKLELLDESQDPISDQVYETEGVNFGWGEIPWEMLTIELDVVNPGACYAKVTLVAIINSSGDDVSGDYIAYDGIQLILHNNETANLRYAPGAFMEAASNDGSITTTKTVTLTGDTFVDEPFSEGTHYTTANVPEGLTLIVTRDSDTQVTLSLTGNAAAHEDTDSVTDLTITFLDAAFTGGSAADIENSAKSDMAIAFAKAPKLVYQNWEFRESNANDGAIQNSQYAFIEGTTFAEGPFIENTLFRASNVPEGMTLRVTRDTDIQVIIWLDGAAENHSNADDVSDLTIEFLDAAFVNVAASNIINATKNDLVIDFNDLPELTYLAGAFAESEANDGSIVTTKTVTLTGDTFAAGPFGEDTHYTVANVPAGLTLVVTRDSGTQVTLSLSGQAISHNNADDVSDLTIEFLDAAFQNVAASGVINAVKSDLAIDFMDTPSGGGGGSGSGSNAGTPVIPPYQADVTGTDTASTSLPVSVNTDTNSAAIDLGALADSMLSGKGAAVITLPTVPGVNTYTLGIPADSLSDSKGEGSLTFSTDAGSITLPSDMLSSLSGAVGKKAEISIGQGDKSDLPEDIRAAIGDRPLVQLTLTLDGARTEWRNPNAPVTVNIPYTPTPAELASPESIVVWYIDGSGNAICIPNGRYDPATGTVTFATNHFSYYAVSFSSVSFKDVDESAWYAKAVSFITARDITNGTGGGKYSPEADLTRGPFMVMLMKAYGIAPDENPDPEENFIDAGDTWYTGYLSVAKRLGISAGVGGNRFAPEKIITRQEMFTLLYNALKALGQLEADVQHGMTLSSFSDGDQIAPWALEAMRYLVENGIVSGSGGKLLPEEVTNRAQMAQVLYGLLTK